MSSVTAFAVSVLMSFEFQASKGARWMPWGRGPMKDVVSDDTPGGAAIRL